jgi:PKD repeat protein
VPIQRPLSLFLARPLGSRGVALFTLAAACLVAACGSGDLTLPGDGAASTIGVVGGNEQTGVAGEALTAPIVVEVTDAAGHPVEGATVAFALVSAGEGAAISPATARTGADGRTEAQVQLGDKVGIQTGEVRLVSDGAPTATATFAAAAMAAGEPPSPLPNLPPEADFEVVCTQLRCVFVDRSGDADGAVVTWHWEFGDGTSSAERNPTHDYAAGGRYDVALLVTDDGGAADSRIKPAEPEAPTPNDPPHAEFEVHCLGRTCAFFDESKDDDGTIASWQWDFGDGTTSTERNPIHTFALPGQFDALLTVTDDDGAAAGKTHRVDIKG